MPVRYVRIDPGDDSDGYQPGIGSYPNHRGKVASGGAFVDLCKPPSEAVNFGVSTEACVSKDFRFRTNYGHDE